MQPPIFHLADAHAWAAAVEAGRYESSTRGRTLADEGFIHCSYAAQWPIVRRAFYADVRTPLLLLTIDPDRLASPVRVELGNPSTGEQFPHIYGPLNPGAVVAVEQLEPPHDHSP
ncbi:MAG: DUF952 domain-containing protein [Nostocoides sp.]